MIWFTMTNDLSKILTMTVSANWHDASLNVQ